ncbi:hypothetical protein OC846_002440 [Tilletia horrida]|uniref:Pre-rRNA-processing protein RIX1 n=1 Tax=Tilletia horrida TaxID=155126 RepID=A0AAN6JS47_9BASI|nr:hypothetical protein OC845_001969 [Tilletia horrida]KAK0553599.1 hypothetical protein OC846_002440 [Tilletia horrida]KAK0567551.1 hypothetical protein OC861_002672 [Tilletia horrida]
MVYIGARLSGSGSSNASEARILQQQLTKCLERVDETCIDAIRSPSPAATASLELSVSQLRQSGTIARLNALASSTASESAISSLERLVTRCNSLISTNIARTDGPSSQLKGYLLVFEVASQMDFDLWASHASAWAQHAVSLLSSASATTYPLLLRAAVQILDSHLLGGPAGSRLDYNRQVVLPNVPKLAAALLNIAESFQESDLPTSSELLLDVLSYLNSQLNQFPSIYRPVAARIHDLSIKVVLDKIDAREPAFTSLHATAARLLITLHLTGASDAAAAKRAGSANASRATQAQLWGATVGTFLRTMNDASSALISTFQTHHGSVAVSGDRLPITIPPQDDHDHHQIVFSTFMRLNAALHVMLSCPTPSAVPIPAGAIFAGATRLLSLSPLARMKPGSDASLHSLQTSDLPALQMASMSLIAVAASACQETAQTHAAQLLAVLSTFVQRNTADATLRVAALRTITVLLGNVSLDASAGSALTARVCIDPASRVLPRIVQACLSEVSRLFTASSSSAQDNINQANNSSDGSARKAKRQRVFESSTLLGQGTDTGPFPGKTAESLNATSTAVALFGSLYAHLSCNIRPAHADLSQTGVLLVIALGELLLHGSAAGNPAVLNEAVWDNARVELTVTSLSVLVHVISIASGRILSLASSRCLTVFELGRRSPSPRIRAAALNGIAALDQVVHPRLPVLLPLRLATEEDIGAEAAAWGDEERKLVEVETDNVRGVSEQQALTRVLDVSPSTAPHEHNAMSDSLAAESSESASAGQKRLASESLDADVAQHAQLHQHSHPSISSNLRASPDPVKPLHRPSTPRIGSPSPARKPFVDRAEDRKAPETPTKRPKEVSGEGLTHTSGAVEGAEGNEDTGPTEVAGNPRASDGPELQIPQTAASGKQQQSASALLSAADGEDSDEEMPQIDLGTDSDDDQ